MHVVERAVHRLGSSVEFWVSSAARTVALLLGVGLAWTHGRWEAVVPAALGLTVIAIVAGVVTRRGSLTIKKAAIAVESVVVPFLVLGNPETSSVLLPAFYPPILAAAFVGFGFMATCVGILSVMSLTAAVLGQGSVTALTPEIAVWLILVAGVGSLTVALRHLRIDFDPRDADVAAARSILEDLRTVARRLPGYLDVATVRQQILQHVERVLPLEDGEVVIGDEALAAVDEYESSLADLRSRQNSRADKSGTSDSEYVAPDRDDDRLVLALEVRERVVGAVVGHLTQSPWRTIPLKRDLEMQAADLAGLAARLELALLFEEVRQEATGDERRRLAREIHDGIAQDLVYIGYALEDIAHESADVHTTSSLTRLREQVSQLVNDLRMSIYDLRHDVGPSRSLGVALTDYLQHVNTTADLRIHLSLTESRNRLDIAQETELLRVAQEAVSNVRRHARATNLWVTCRIDDRFAYLQVRDDGVGVSDRQPGGFGLLGMQERAHRIGADFGVSEHPGGGTVVEMHLERAGQAEVHSAAAREPMPPEASPTGVPL
jgi:signal transduction histidine kinase